MIFRGSTALCLVLAASVRSTAAPAEAPAAAQPAAVAAPASPAAPAASSAPAVSSNKAEAPVAVAPAAKTDGASEFRIFDARRQALLADVRRWYMDDSGKAAAPELVFSPADEKAYVDSIKELRGLAAQVAFMKRGRYEGWDDEAAYADMAVLVAARLGVKPAESALPLYRDLVRDPKDALSSDEEAIRSELATAIRSPDFERRYLYITDLIGLPGPDPRIASEATQAFVERIRKGRRRVKRVVVRKVEVAPPPKPVSIIEQVDWDKADELAEVAGENAHGWDRKPKESLRRYNRRLRRLRAHCYEWVRRDLTALGFWDASLFRGYVPPTRWDRKRPIRAASFALAMAKVEAAEEKNDPLAGKTSLRQLNLRVDPLVRGSIIVFSQSVCGYDARNGHIEIVTSVDPLRAASYKFHRVTTECLVRASNENKVHVYIPLRLDPARRVSNQPFATKS